MGGGWGGHHKPAVTFDLSVRLLTRHSGKKRDPFSPKFPVLFTSWSCLKRPFFLIESLAHTHVGYRHIYTNRKSCARAQRENDAAGENHRMKVQRRASTPRKGRKHEELTHILRYQNCLRRNHNNTRPLNKVSVIHKVTIIILWKRWSTLLTDRQNYCSCHSLLQDFICDCTLRLIDGWQASINRTTSVTSVWRTCKKSRDNERRLFHISTKT